MLNIVCAFLDLAKNATTPLIAIFVAYVAWQQWKTAKTKLRLDLFEKRFACYRRAQASINSLLKGLGPKTDICGEVFQNLLESFYELQTEAHMLFGDDVDAALNKIYSELQGLIIRGSDLQYDCEPSMRAVAVQDIVARRTAIMHLQEEFYAVCEKYIRIEYAFNWPSTLLRRIYRYTAACRAAIAASFFASSRFFCRRS